MAQLINDASDTKSHLVTRAALRAIFAQAQPSIGDNLPPELMRAIDSSKKEQVVGITQVGLAQLLDIGLSQPSLKLAVRRLDRGYHEYFGQQFQVVTAACIHDATRVLLLRLNRTQDVEGYYVGTLTYPQGHVQYTEKFTNDYCSGEQMTTMHGIICHARDEIYRELMEEIRIEDFYANLKLFDAMKERLFGPKPENIVYPIHVDLAGTMHRHVCLLFDVDMTDTVFESVADQIVSGEPEKHRTVVANYGTLESVNRIDDICAWVRNSIPLLPFYTRTFIPLRRSKGVN